LGGFALFLGLVALALVRAIPHLMQVKALSAASDFGAPGNEIAAEMQGQAL
jgi:hypothetical protein